MCMEQIRFKEVNMKRWYLGVVALVFVGLITVVFAQGPGPNSAAGGPGGPGRPGMMGEPGTWGPGGGHPEFGPGARAGFGRGAYLDLSKEQLDKMRGMRDRFYNETRDLRYEMAQKQLEMKKLFTDPKTDNATLLAKQKEMSALRVKLMDKMAQMMIEGRKIMTPEQLQKIDQMGMGPGGMDGGTMMLGMMGGPMVGTW
jgi:Spy/CpxP family protein refolding chaperone